jgi:hypothetical protein
MGAIKPPAFNEVQIMIIRTHHTTEINVGGTALCGQLRGVTYDQLVATFGEPQEPGEYKVDAEWYLEVTDHDGSTVIATIYNWKNGKNYLGKDGTPTEKITTWNIGGHTQRAAEIVEKLVQGR